MSNEKKRKKTQKNFRTTRPLFRGMLGPEVGSEKKKFFFEKKKSMGGFEIKFAQVDGKIQQTSLNT